MMLQFLFLQVDQVQVSMLLQIKLQLQIKVVNNINGQLVIDNNDNHKKLILDVNGKTINGENQTAITYNGNDTLEIKGQGLITSGGTVRVSANGSGSYNATPTLGDGTVVITMTSPNFDITFNETYTPENEPYRDRDWET